MKHLKITGLFLTIFLASSCFERVKFDNAQAYYLKHISCGAKQYGVFDVSYTHNNTFPKLWTDTLTVGGKLYVNVVLIELPDTLTGNYYGIDYHEVGNTKINCKEFQHLGEISSIRKFYFLNRNRPFEPS